MTKTHEKPRKIIHIDMDCFYAAIEMRDNPALLNQPIAVGGSSDKRGVLCTCNYLARQYGVRSAMPTATALRLCPNLIVLPVNMKKYKQVAKRIHAVFHEFTDLVEPLALDEAYLDVSNSKHYRGSATLIAQAIRERIWEMEKLTASAGVAPNKCLAKIASTWKKPNGLFTIRPQEVEEFVKILPVTKLFGVGKVMAEKLHAKGLMTCADLQKVTLPELVNQFGKVGKYLYDQCRGIDLRPVQPNRVRKSLSVERTFVQDINHANECSQAMQELYENLTERLSNSAAGYTIKNQYIKIKFHDFTVTTAEVMGQTANFEKYWNLFCEAYNRAKKPIRLLGLGVHFAHEQQLKKHVQGVLF